MELLNTTQLVVVWFCPLWHLQCDLFLISLASEITCPLTNKYKKFGRPSKYKKNSFSWSQTSLNQTSIGKPFEFSLF